MLDQLNTLVKSIPGDRISNLLDETFKAFNGAGPDFQSLIDSATKLSTDTNGVSDQLRVLIDDSGPLLDSQVETADSIRTWARSLAGITGQLAQNDPQFRSILQQGPGFASEVSGLLDQIKPTLPILLANLTTIGQILVTYNPSLEQLLVIFPPAMSMQQSFGLGKNNPTGLPTGDFSLTVSDPNACTVGFLPPVAMAFAGGHDHDRHARRAVLQAAAGLPDRRPRRPKPALHGAPRQAGADRRTLQRPQGL